MTPCEKLGYKVGDRFEVIGEGASDHIEVGDIITLYRDDGTYVPFFQRDGEEFDHDCAFLSSLRPLKTEAEKRGAKFGVGGVIKATGDKGVFWKSSSSYLGEEWYLFMNDGNILVIPSTQIRLDHEPEYKEIPFSEATHKQRMDYKNVLWDGHAGSFSEVLFTHANTYILTVRSKVLPLIYTTHRTDGHTNPTGLTVRIPA